MKKISRVKFLIIMFFLAGTILVGAKSQFLSIKDVNYKFENTPCINDAFRKKTDLKNKNILTVDESQFKKLTEQYSCISEIKLDKSFPNKVSIIVLGRAPQAIINISKIKNLLVDTKEATPSSQSAILENINEQTLGDFISSGSKFLVDKEGVVFSQNIGSYRLPQINYLVQETNPSRMDKNLLSGSLEVLKKTTQLGLMAKSLFLYNTDLLIITAEGKRIFFDLSSDYKSELASLQLILQTSKIDSHKLEMIDLRFDKPVVIYSQKK